MSSLDEQDGRAGRIVTFYSYKGGTGRTMALANAAWILADVGVSGDRIQAVGTLGNAVATKTIDAGGLALSPGFIDVHVAPRDRRIAPLRPRRLAAVLGTPVPEERSKTILAGLGFEEVAEDQGAPVFAIPSWRSDVAREIDLIEEVVRHHGLGKLPSTIPGGAAAGGLRPWQVKERKLRDALVGSARSGGGGNRDGPRRSSSVRISAASAS